MKRQSFFTFPNALAVLGAWVLIPAFYGLCIFVLVQQSRRSPVEAALFLGAVTTLLVFLDSSKVEMRFRETRVALPRRTSGQEAAGLLFRLLARYCLVLVCAVAALAACVQYRVNPRWLAWVAFLASGGVVYLLFHFLQHESAHVRGQEMITFGEAKRRGSWGVGVFDRALAVVPTLWVSKTKALRFGVVILGAPGSGKTVLITQLMNQVFRGPSRLARWAASAVLVPLEQHLPRGSRVWAPVREALSSPVRGIVYDGTGEGFPQLAGLQPGAALLNVNPFDDPLKSYPGMGEGVFRCVAWAIGRDCPDIASCETIARGMVPVHEMQKAGHGDPFWPMAAWSITSAVLVTLMYKKPGFTFGDFVRSFETPEDLQALLRSTSYGRQCETFIATKGNSSGDVMKTLINYMRQVRTAAAAMERATKSVSLRDWAKEGGILVLTVDERIRAPLDVYYRLLFGAATQVLLAPGQHTNGSTYVFLDEIREAGYWPTLNSILVRGRAKKVHCCLAYQSQSGFEQAMGSRELASEIFGICQTQIVANLSEGYTKEYVSSAWGEHEVLLVKRGADGIERLEPEVKRAVLASDLNAVQEADPREGMSGYIKSPTIGKAVCRFELSGRATFAGLPRPASIPALEVVANESQELSPWSAEEREALGLPPLVPPPEAPTNEDQEELQQEFEVERATEGGEGKKVYRLPRRKRRVSGE